MKKARISSVLCVSAFIYIFSFFILNLDLLNAQNIDYDVLITNAVKTNDLMSVKEYYNKGGNINASDSCGLSLLLLSIANKNDQMTKFIISEGADLSGKDKNGNTALHESVKKGNYEIVKLLLENGADYKAKNNDGITPLYLASMFDMREIIDKITDKYVFENVIIKPELYIQTGHTSWVNAILFSPNGKLLASASCDNSIRLWDVFSFKEIRSLTAHSDWVNCLSFSPNGRILASGSNDKTIKLWDINTGKVIKSFECDAKIHTIHFNPGGDVLAAAGNDSTLIYMDMKSDGKIIFQRKNNGPVVSFDFSPDGKIIAVSSGNLTVNILDASTLESIEKLTVSNNLRSIIFSPDGRFIAGCQVDKKIIVLDLKTKNIIKNIKGHTASINSIMVDKEGKYLASGSSDKQVKLWDLQTGNEVRTLSGHTGEVNTICFSPDGKTIASGGFNKSIKLWDIESGMEICSLSGHASSVTSFNFIGDGSILANGSWDNSIKFWDLQKGRLLNYLVGHSGPVNTISFCKNKDILASGSDDNNIILWDIKTGREIKTLKGHRSWINSVSISREGDLIASGSFDHTIKLWDVEKGSEIITFNNNNRISCVEFDSTGRLLFSAGWDNVIRLWDIETKKEIRTFKGHTSWINNFCLSPDEKYIASAGNDRTIKLWDIRTGSEIKTFYGHSGPVNTIKFNSNGTLLVSGSDDKSSRIWNIQSGDNIKTFNGHQSGIYSCNFYPDGKTVVTGSIDATIRFWDVESGNELCSLIALDSADWIVMTPEGRFDGTKSGMKLMHYVQGIRPLALESFFENLYTPNIFSKIMAGELQQSKNFKIDFSREITLPPFVKILSANIKQKVTTEKISIVLEIADLGGGIDEVRLYQNGKLIISDMIKFKKSFKKIIKKYDINLLPGINIIGATAFNQDRTELTPYSEIEFEFNTSQSTIDLYILSIGINVYKNPRYDLSFCKSDASDFSKIMEKIGKNIFRSIIIHNIFDSDAIKSKIEAKFNLIRKSARPQDAFIFYYAGHGAMSDGRDSFPPDFYLMLSDITQTSGNDEILDLKGISSKHLRDYCKEIKATKQLVILDACHSGAAVKAFQYSRGGLEEEKSILQLARSAGLTILAASTEDQLSRECSELGHGSFTYTLLNGLSGDAAVHDKRITVTGLKQYLDLKVPEVTLKCSKKEQYPYGSVYGQDFPIGVVNK